MTNDSNRPDVAVFIDFENVYVSVRDKFDANPNFETIMDRCEELGRVVIARAYADWYRYPRITSALYANGVEPMYVPTYYYDREMGRTGRAIKNSVDMNLCVDAMKTLFTNTNIAKFVLATGDRDFIPLVNTIRQQGKEVIIIGIGGAASAHLAQSADEFIFYEALLGKKTDPLLPDQPSTKKHTREQTRPISNGVAKPAEPVSHPTSDNQTDVYDVLVRAIHLARERGYVCSFGSLKLLMKELMGGEFKEDQYKDSNGKPLTKFKDFVMEAEHRGKVQVFTNGTVNEIFLPGEDPYELSQFAQDLKDAGINRNSANETDRGNRSAPIGRSRRRRRPRRNRGDEPGFDEQSQPSDGDADDVFQDSISTKGATTTAYTEPASVEQFGYIPMDVPPFVPSPDSPPMDQVFEDLLERIEQEKAAKAARESLDLLDVKEGVPTATENQKVTQDQTDLQSDSLTINLPFTEAEWQTLRDVMQQFPRPVSFAKIHDTLREVRNSDEIGIARTNEELRTLVKQAINNGMFTRTGKGNRVTYQLAETTTEDGDATEILEGTLPVAETGQEQLVSSGDKTDQFAALAELSPEHLVEAGIADEQSGALLETPEIIMDTPVDISDAIADSFDVDEQQDTSEVPDTTQSVVEGLSDNEATVAVVEARAKPKRRTRRKKVESTVEVAPLVEGAESEETVAEARAKPKRRTRKHVSATSLDVQEMITIEEAGAVVAAEPSETETKE
ncbi:MAG: NYN domain-containing protein [Chloroflexi bacterium AL-N1]|nr:NYN domain-containing protein [Chloroflexi bacterium AL-N1]